MIDSTLAEMGKKIFNDVFNNSPCEDWDYCSSLIYQNKLVQYANPYPYSFYDQTQFDQNAYAEAFKERHGEKTEAEVWAEIKTTLIADLQRCEATKVAMVGIINQY